LADVDGNARRVVRQTYGRFRLLTFDHDPVTRGPTVEIAHEALIRTWPRLRRWVDEDRDDIRQPRELAAAARQWKAGAAGLYDAGYLLTGSRLDHFQSWAAQTEIQLTRLEQEFLEISQQVRYKKLTDEHERREREMATLRRLAEEQTLRAEEQAESAAGLRRRSLFLSAALIIAAILAITAVSFSRIAANNADLAAARAAEALTNADLAATREGEAQSNANLAATREAEAAAERGIALTAQAQALAEANVRATAEAIAVQERINAEQQADLSFARELSLAAANNLESDPELSILLAQQALGITNTLEAESVLRIALQESRTLRQFTAVGGFAVYHPDGTLAATSTETELLIWDTTDGSVAVRIPHPAPARLFSPDGSRMFTPDGSQLVVGDENGGVTIYDTTTGVQQHFIQAFEGYVSTLDITPDGRLLAVGSDTGVLAMWDLETMTNVYTLQASEIGWINRAHFTPDGARLATAGDDFFIRLWDSTTGEELLALGPDLNYPMRMAFSADGALLYAVLGDGELFGDVRVWDVSATAVSTDTPQSTFANEHDALVNDLIVSPDGSRIATAGLDSTIHVWDSANPGSGPILRLSGHRGGVFQAEFDPTGERIMSSSTDGIRIWDISTAGPGEIQNIAAHDIWISGAAYSPDGTRLTTAGSDGLIQTWDAATADLIAAWPAHAGDVWWIQYAPDGSALASGGLDQLVKIWNPETGELLQTLSGHGEGMIGGLFVGVMAVEYSPDGSMLASAGADGTARIWDPQTGAELAVITPAEGAGGVTRVKFSPDGAYLVMTTDAVFAADAPVGFMVWDITRGEILYVNSDFDTPRIWGLDVSPDGRYIAIGETGGALAFYHADSGAPAFTLEGHASTIFHLTFSPDGALLASADIQGSVRLWDVANQTLFKELYQHGGGVDKVRFSPDGRHVVTVGQELIARIFTLDQDELLAIVTARATRPLRDDECRRYLHSDGCPAE
jgi:WD40 repeat protein